MKMLLLAISLVASASAFSSEAYNCNFGGTRFLLTIHEDDTAMLESGPRRFPCEIKETNSGKTKLICAGKFKKTTYGLREQDEETIILTTSGIFSKDVICKKN